MLSGFVSYSVKKIPSYRETVFYANIVIENIGDSALNDLIVKEAIQNGFIAPDPEDVEVLIRRPEADDNDLIYVDNQMIRIEHNEISVELVDLVSSSIGMFLPSAKYEITYPIIANKPKGDTSYVSNVIIYANTYPASEIIEFRPKSIEIPIKHLRSSFYDVNLVEKWKNGVKDQNKISLFFSYRLSDSHEYLVMDIAQFIKQKKEISKVRFYCWELWDGYPNGNINDFMEEGLRNCDVFIPFFSKDYFNSPNCKKEYEAAQVVNKFLIPVYMNFDDVPFLCKARKGIDLTRYSAVEEVIDELFALILSFFHKK